MLRKFESLDIANEMASDAAHAERDILPLVAVRSASTGHSPLSAQSLGAPPATSLLADPTALSVQTDGDMSTLFNTFFGEGQFPYKSNFDVGDQSTWTLPQAYQGQPLPRVSETIEQLVFMAGNWYQQVVAPVVPTSGIGVRWSRWEFNPHLADITPELGVNRLVSSRRQENSATFERRAIGFMLEHGFMLTQEGVLHYMMNVNQLVQAAVETNKFDLIHTLLSAHDQNRRWLSENGLLRGKTVYDVYKDDELFYWDIVKRQKNGMELLDTRISERMNRWRGDADTWIIHPNVPAYLTQQRPEKTDYLVAGPSGPQTLRDGPDAFTVFRNNLVFETRGFHVSNEDPIDPLRFLTEIGEHHWMCGRDDMHSLEGIKYSTALRSVQIYDERKDNFVTISLAAALRNCQRFDSETGEPLSFSMRGGGEAYSQAQLATDVLHYRTRSGKIEPVVYFANVSDAQLGASTRLALGSTIAQQMTQLAGAERAERLLGSVRDAIAQMEAYEWNTDTKDFLGWIMTANPGKDSVDSSARTSGNIPLYSIKEFKGSPVTGAMKLPDDAKAEQRKDDSVASSVANGYLAPGGLPPGFQSYEGIKEIVSVWTKIRGDAAKVQESIFASVQRELLDDLADFVRLFEQIVGKLRTILPSSELLSAKNASTWWQRPTPASVLFNNAVHKLRVPLWYKAGGKLAADASGAIARELLGLITAIQTPATKITVIPAELKKAVDVDISANKLSNDDEIATAWNVLFLSFLVKSVSDDDTSKKLDTLEEDVYMGIFNGSFSKKVTDAKALFTKLQKLANPKAKSSPFFKVSIDEIMQQAVAINDKLESISKIDTAGNVLPPDASIASFARTTLLVAPRLLEGMAADLGNKTANFAFTWLPSDPVIPDLPIDLNRLTEQADLSKGASSGREAAFIDHELDVSSLDMDSDRVSAAAAMAIDSMSFIHFANSVEMVGQRHPEYVSATEDSGFSTTRRTVGASGNSREFIGDDLGYIGYNAGELGYSGIDARGPTDLTGGLAPGTGGVEPSRRGLGQGFSRMFASREALLSESSRRNFAELAMKGRDSWEYIFASAFNLSRVTRQQLELLLEKNVLFPFNFLLARPHARYWTNTAIKVKRGTDTVATYQRRGRFEVGDDVSVGMHVGNYRYYSKVVVKEPKNVAIARNIFVDGYEAGMGSEFIRPDEYRPRELEYGSGSLFSFLVGYNESDDTAPGVINLSGGIDDLRVIFELGDERGLHYSSAPYYAMLWGWAYGESFELGSSASDYVNERPRINFNTLKGKTLLRDPMTNRFDIVDSARGHWGNDYTYTGCAAARRGAAAYRPPNNVGVTFL